MKILKKLREQRNQSKRQTEGFISGWRVKDDERKRVQNKLDFEAFLTMPRILKVMQGSLQNVYG